MGAAEGVEVAPEFVAAEGAVVGVAAEAGVVGVAEVDEATDTVTIKYDGPSITTIFNPEFMLVPLTNLTSDEITIELNNASSPGLIKDETTFLYLIMPLRV